MAPASLRHARRGAVFAMLAAVLLANPLYIGLFVDEPRQRSPVGYTAVAVDPASPEDQETIIAQLGDEEILDIDRLRGAEGERYAAPTRAAEVLRQARDRGTTRTTGANVTFTLRRVEANHRYVVFPETGRYYRFAVERRNNTTVVTTTPVNQSDVAQFLVHRDIRRYSSLPEYQRETVRKVIESDRAGYRPYNEEFTELTDALLRKDGTYYVFVQGIHVDDFGITTRDLLTAGLSALGVLSLLAGVLFTALAYREGASE